MDKPNELGYWWARQHAEPEKPVNEPEIVSVLSLDPIDLSHLTTRNRQTRQSGQFLKFFICEP